MAQPEERPDFRLSYLSGPTPSPDSLQPPPLGGSSQPATRRDPSESLGLEFLRKWFHFDIVYFTVYTYCKGSCYSSLNRRWSSWAGNEWLWYWVGWLLWRENRWVIWQWRGLSIAVGCSWRKGFWVFFFGDDEPEVSSHSTAPLDPKNAKIVTWHQTEFDQSDVPWFYDTSTRDIYLLESAESPLELFQKSFTDELCGLLAEKTDNCFVIKTGN